MRIWYFLTRSLHSLNCAHFFLALQVLQNRLVMIHHVFCYLFFELFSLAFFPIDQYLAKAYAAVAGNDVIISFVMSTCTI